MKRPQLSNFKLYYEKTKKDLPKIWEGDTTHRLYRDWNREATRDIIKDLIKWVRMVVGKGSHRISGRAKPNATAHRFITARHKFGAVIPKRIALQSALKRRAFHIPKPKWEYVVIAFLIGLLISGGRVHAIPDTGDKFTHLPKIAKLSVKKPEKVAPVYVAAPAPKPAPRASTQVTGGCATYWSGDYYLDNIIRFESSGNSCATNPGGCFGLLQACPGYPLRAACGGNPSCQIAWFRANKTGGRSWAQVWAHELQFGWW